MRDYRYGRLLGVVFRVQWDRSVEERRGVGDWAEIVFDMCEKLEKSEEGEVREKVKRQASFTFLIHR